MLVPYAANLDVGAQGSIVFWMRADASNAMNWCCQGLVTTDFFSVEISGGSDPVVGVNFFVNTTAGGFVHTSDANGGGAVVTPGEWHHIAGTYDGTKLQLYVDGAAWGNPRFSHRHDPADAAGQLPRDRVGGRPHHVRVLHRMRG